MYLLTHSLVLVAVMKPKVLKTKVSHADPPTLSLSRCSLHAPLGALPLVTTPTSAQQVSEEHWYLSTWHYYMLYTPGYIFSYTCCAE